MDPNSLALLMGSAGAAAGPATYVEDVFQTWLYTGNGGTQTITNGIDLSGKGGLVWTKYRSGSFSTSNLLVDTARGTGKHLVTNTNNVEAIASSGVTSFTSTGYALSNDVEYNTSTATYASWTFRKQAKFFDVVTYTGNGSNRTVAHSLGSVPGCIIVKRTDTTGDWQVYHSSLANTEYMVLNTTAAKATGATRWNSTTPTSTEFSLGTDVTVNANAGTYVAYLFAHDAGGFGATGSDSISACGTYTGNGVTNGPTVTLNWEPQWLLIKRTDTTADWQLIDNMRGFVVGGTDAELNPNLSAAESTGTFVTPLPTGFKLNTNDAGYNASSGTYIYIAIRRGPMKTPTDATKVFYADAGNDTTGTTITTSFPVDLMIQQIRNASTDHRVLDRLRSLSSTTTETGIGLSTYATSAESSDTGQRNWSNTGYQVPSNFAATSRIFWNFRRAPGFLDVVTYNGDGVAGRTVTHNLGAKPLINIVKRRDTVAAWTIYTDLIDGSLDFLQFDTTAKQDSTQSVPTSTVFSVSSGSNVNASGGTYISYMFGNVSGISKCGVYTGTGTTLNIDCGFTAGARFVLIKRTDTAGYDWYVWDTARGIVAANDPYLLLNTTAAEVTTTDYIDPLSSGFQISSTAPAAINGSGGTFLYLAIA